MGIEIIRFLTLNVDTENELKEPEVVINFPCCQTQCKKTKVGDMKLSGQENCYQPFEDSFILPLCLKTETSGRIMAMLPLKSLIKWIKMHVNSFTNIEDLNPWGFFVCLFYVDDYATETFQQKALLF